MLGIGVQVTRAAVPARQTAVFDPASLFAAGEAGGWWDPSDLSSMFQDSAGTIAAAVDGPVGRISDRSGRSHHLVQASAAARPTLRQDVGGRRYLQFDGVDDQMATMAFAVAIQQPSCAYFGWRTDDPTAPLFDGLTSGNRQHVSTADTATIWFAGGAVATGAATRPAGDAVDGCTFAGASSIYRRNGVQTAAGNPGAASLDGLRLGTWQGQTTFMAGRVYGLVIRAGLLSGRQQGDLEGWLAAKAGLQI